MSSDDLFGVAMALLMFGVVLIILGLSQWRIKRLIENTPTSKIRGIAMGFVEIQGKISKGSSSRSLLRLLVKRVCITLSKFKN